MGGSKGFAKRGEYTFESVGTISGIKVLKGIEGTGKHGLPKFSNTSEAYIKPATVRNGIGKPSAIRIMKGQAGYKDIEWGHPHRNPDGRLFKRDEPHVHDLLPNGGHSPYARKPSKRERRLMRMVKYGKFQPN